MIIYYDYLKLWYISKNKNKNIFLNMGFFYTYRKKLGKN
jgi:hypothetical protein